MQLTPRQQEILQWIVELYSETSEPIGSKKLLQESVMTVSPATIRNDMFILEQMGLLMKAHSSSGRIPSFDAYRYYANQLIMQLPTEKLIKSRLSEVFSARYYDSHQLILQVAETLSTLTQHTVIVKLQSNKEDRLKRFVLSQVSSTQLMASIITDTSDVQSQVFELPYAFDDTTIQKLQQTIQEELEDLPLSEVYQRLKLTLPLKIQRVIPIQLNFETLAEKMLLYTSRDDYQVIGKNQLLDLLDVSDSQESWKSLFSLIDGDPEWLHYLDAIGLGINVTLNFKTMNYEYRNLSLVTAKTRIGSSTILLGVVGLPTMPYSTVIQYLNEIMNELPNY